MIVAAMQPYFFPYIGYFQLMQAADTFVFLDDVQYIQRGWVNRNRVRAGDRWIWLTRAVEKAPRELAIVQRRYVDSGPGCASDLRRRVDALYRGATSHASSIALLTSLFDSPERNVAHFNRRHIEVLARELEITTPCIDASEVAPRDDLRGQERIIDLCRKLGASTYINPIGGVCLYDEPSFQQAGIQLLFLRTKEAHVQLQPEPTHLSIIDHLMHDGIDETARRMPHHELLSPWHLRTR